MFIAILDQVASNFSAHLFTGKSFSASDFFNFELESKSFEILRLSIREKMSRDIYILEIKTLKKKSLSLLDSEKRNEKGMF